MRMLVKIGQQVYHMRIMRQWREGYELLGTPCEPFEYGIAIADANSLRQAVVGGVIAKNPKTRVPHLTDTSDKTLSGRRLNIVPGEQELTTPGIFIGAMLHHPNESDWRMKLLMTKTGTSEFEYRNTRVEKRIIVEVMNGILVHAKRYVRVVRGVGMTTIASLEEPEVIIQRKCFERPLMPEDCQKLMQQIEQFGRYLDTIR